LLPQIWARLSIVVSKTVQRTNIRIPAFIAVAWIAAPAAALAQTDEIQVYDAAIAGVGKFNGTLHGNFTPKGLKTPAFPGAITPDKSLNGAAEWAWGVTNWFEAGLYLPLYSVDDFLGAKINGGKIRLLFASPHADYRTFFYGVNFELSYNSKHWDERRITSEVRPIVGWHLHPVDIILNPILDTSYTGGLKNFDFAPATRVAYNLKKYTLAIEEYGDFGPLKEFVPVSQQSHQIYGVIDHAVKSWEIEAGVGVGVTAGSDKLTLKLILTRSLN
jgi:hypothetical protein